MYNNDEKLYIKSIRDKVLTEYTIINLCKHIKSLLKQITQNPKFSKKLLANVLK